MICNKSYCCSLSHPQWINWPHSPISFNFFFAPILFWTILNLYSYPVLFYTVYTEWGWELLFCFPPLSLVSHDRHVVSDVIFHTRISFFYRFMVTYSTLVCIHRQNKTKIHFHYYLNLERKWRKKCLFSFLGHSSLS